MDTQFSSQINQKSELAFIKVNIKISRNRIINIGALYTQQLAPGDQIFFLTHIPITDWITVCK